MVTDPIITTLILALGVGFATVVTSYVFLVTVQPGQLFEKYLNFLALKLLSSDIKKFRNGEQSNDPNSVLEDLRLLSINTQGFIRPTPYPPSNVEDTETSKALESLDQSFQNALASMRKESENIEPEISPAEKLLLQNLETEKMEGLKSIASKHKYLYKALGGCGFCFNFWFTNFVFWVSFPTLLLVGPTWFTWWVYLLFTPFVSLITFRFITTSWSIFKYLES